MLANKTMLPLLGLSAVLLAGIGLAVYTYGSLRYQAGLDAGTFQERALWQKWYVEETQKLNRRIVEIEAESTEQRKIAEASTNDAALRISTLLKQLETSKAKYNTVVYDRRAKPAQCETQEIHLGTDFSQSWNEFNKEVK